MSTGNKSGFLWRDINELPPIKNNIRSPQGNRRTRAQFRERQRIETRIARGRQRCIRLKCLERYRNVSIQNCEQSLSGNRPERLMDIAKHYGKVVSSLCGAENESVLISKVRFKLCGWFMNHWDGVVNV